MLVDYETVDTLDEVHNHNLRNVLKQFGNWPTIPQVYHNGDFLGGHDILERPHDHRGRSPRVERNGPKPVAHVARAFQRIVAHLGHAEHHQVAPVAGEKGMVQ